MKELRTFAWYAKQVAPHLPKQAFQPVPARLWGGFAYLLVILTGFLIIGLFNPHPLISIMISIVIGASFAAMGFLGHEILHGTVVRKPWLRNLLGAIAFWPLCTGPLLWTKWHNLNHHVHTQDEHKDPDAWPSIQQLLTKPLVVRMMYKLPLFVRSFMNFSFLCITFTMHSLRMFVLYLKEFKPRKRPAVWLQLILPWASWIGLLMWVGFAKWLFMFLLPLLIANFIVMCYISTNHRLNPLVPVNDPLANSLTVIVPRWVDALHFHFSYHTEHHLFPGMSGKYYPLVKEQLKRMWPERYHEMPMHKALLALWKTPRLYYENEEFVDPRAGNVYESLSTGLDPKNIRYRHVEEAKLNISAKLSDLQELGEIKVPKTDK